MPSVPLRLEILETSIFTTRDILAYSYNAVNRRKAEGHYEVRYGMLIVYDRNKGMETLEPISTRYGECHVAKFDKHRR